MLKFHCAKCGKIIKAPGGIILSPPDNDILDVVLIDTDVVYKKHICKLCHKELLIWLNS
jgi:hypothetical protein